MKYRTFVEVLNSSDKAMLEGICKSEQASRKARTNSVVDTTKAFELMDQKGVVSLAYMSQKGSNYYYVVNYVNASGVLILKEVMSTNSNDPKRIFHAFNLT